MDERRDRYIDIYYIYILIERGREKERERESERQTERKKDRQLYIHTYI